MSGPFTASLRSRPGVLRLGTGSEPLVTIRVQVPEVWDTLRVEAHGDTPVAVVKARALQVLMPDAEFPEDFAIKLAGWEVLDENASITAAGASNGSIFLVTSRRRHAVR